MRQRLLFHPPAHPEPPRNRAWWYYGMLAASLLAAGLAYLVLTGVELE